MTANGLFAADNDVDLDAYCARIAYSGPSVATLKTLAALHELHPRAIAFENLDPLLGRLPVKLDLVSLTDKLLRGRRGGYCFEQNLLFGHVLAALGFRVTGMAARVLWNQTVDAKTPRGHMLLKVEVGGVDYIADVGFGALTLTAPLRLETDIVQQTPHESFRLIKEGAGMRLEAQLGEEWRSVYRFGLEEQIQADYEITNYYLSSHPDSHFRRGLIAARPTEDGRFALSGNRLTFHARGGRSQRRILNDVAELRDVLTNLFLVDVPEGKENDAALAAALAS